ncbi:ChbG/HpnK family deacetylase [Patescibacteria group bacterium]|nr:ChbG/HpnK family deacetylase [Patescibacteria group bacterium]
MKRLIVNADDLGYANGINEGIVKAHREGIVTSTSLMVKGKAASHGVKLVRKNPKLGLGLHFQIENDDLEILWQTKRVIASALIEKTKKEFLNQVETFKEFVGKLPDHIDSHHHVHKMPRIYPFIRRWCRENNVPYRLKINFIDSFFGMPSTNAVSIANLVRILNSLQEGASELMCHPGVVTPDLKSSYSHQRELELKTLTSRAVKQEIKKLKIELINWKDL